MSRCTLLWTASALVVYPDDYLRSDFIFTRHGPMHLALDSKCIGDVSNCLRSDFVLAHLAGHRSHMATKGSVVTLQRMPSRSVRGVMCDHPELPLATDFEPPAQDEQLEFLASGVRCANCRAGSTQTPDFPSELACGGLVVKMLATLRAKHHGILL